MGPKMQVNLSVGMQKTFVSREIHFVTKCCGVVTPDPHGFYRCLNVDLIQQQIWM